MKIIWSRKENFKQYCMRGATGQVIMLILLLAMAHNVQASKVTVNTIPNLQSAITSGAADTVVLATGDYTTATTISVGRSCVIMGETDKVSIRTTAYVRHFTITQPKVVLERLILGGVNVSSISNGVITMSAIKTYGNTTGGGGIDLNITTAYTRDSALRVSSCKIRGCNIVSSSFGGGGILTRTVNSSLVVDNSEIGDCYAWAGGGGGILATASLELRNVTMLRDSTGTGNFAYGGAVYAKANLTMSGANEIAYCRTNQSNSDGGAIGIGSGAAGTIGAGTYFHDNGAPNARGGAIFVNGGTLNLSGVRFEKNVARTSGGAIFQSGAASQMEVTNCTFTSNKLTAGSGGAIYYTGTLSVAGSTFTNNTSTAAGGAICNSTNGSLALNSVTMVGNLASSMGGAVYKDTSGTFTVTGTNRFEGNRTTSISVTSNGGGAIYTKVDLTLNGTTFLRNKGYIGGAVHVCNGAKLTLNNITILGDSASFGAVAGIGSAVKAGVPSSIEFNNGRVENCYASNTGGALYCHFSDPQGVITISNSTIYGCRAGGGSAGAVCGRIVNIVDSKVNANSATDNGGAIYATGALSITRSEVQSNQTTGSYGGAIYSTNSLILDAVKIDSNVCYGWGGAISKHTTGTFTISGNSTFIFNFSKTTSQASSSPRPGGAIYTTVAPTISASVLFENNATQSTGGAIHCEDRVNTMSITGATFRGNKTQGAFAGSGGAIFACGPLELENVTMLNNASDGAGGAAYVDTTYGHLRITGQNLFKGNSAAGGGGAIYSLASLTSITGQNIFEDNSTGVGGGGALVAGYVATLRNSSYKQAFKRYKLYVKDAVFKRNTSSTSGAYSEAHGGGGAICFSASALLDGIVIDSCIDRSPSTVWPGNNRGGAAINAMGIAGDSMVLINSRITNNRCISTDGAGLRGSVCIPLIIKNTTFSNNIARLQGGAICVNGSEAYNHTSLFLDSVLIENNVSEVVGSGGGGGIYVSSSNVAANVIIQNSRLEGNKASYSGGAISIGVPGRVVMRYNTVAGNTSSADNGGGFFLASSVRNFLLEKNTVYGNRARLDGGGLYAAASSSGVVMVHNTFANDTAQQSTPSAAGGGAYLAGGATAVFNTFAGNNPSGVYVKSPADVTMLGNIVAASATNNSSKDLQGAALNVSSGYNLVGGAAAAIFDSLDAGGNAQLADNGGKTLTLMLKRGSPAQNRITQNKAIDPQSVLVDWETLLGGSISLQTDQRDSARLERPDVDMGAVERKADKILPTVTLRTDTVCAGATFDLTSLVVDTFYVRSILYFKNAAYTDSIKSPKTYVVEPQSTIYVRCVSLENVLLDTFVNITVRNRAELSAANPHLLTYCETLGVDLASQFSTVAATDTVKLYWDAAATQPMPVDTLSHFKGKGTFYVQAVSPYGCLSTIDSFKVTVDILPTVHINRTGLSPEICWNSQLPLQGDTVNVSNYAWTHSGGAQAYFTNSSSLNSAYVPDHSDTAKTIKVWLTVTGKATCNILTVSDSVAVLILPRTTRASLNIVQQPTTSLPIYFGGGTNSASDTVRYKVAVTAAGAGALYDMYFVAQQPIGQDFRVRGNANFLYNPYVAGTTQNEWTVPDVVRQGNDIIWKVEAANGGAYMHDTLAAADKLALEWKIYNDTCSFVSGSYLTFMLNAKDVCGGSITSAPVQANPIHIDGAPVVLNTYALSLAYSRSAINPCVGDTATLIITAKNTNPGVSDSTVESFVLQLPAEYELVPDSYAGMYKAPSANDLEDNVLPDGTTELRLPMTNGIDMGDSVKFSVKVVPAQNAACGTYNVALSIQYNFLAVNYDPITGVPIDTCKSSKQVLATAAHALTIEKFQLQPATAHVRTYHNGWSGTVPLYNVGPAMPAGAVISLRLYVDANNNSMLEDAERTAGALDSFRYVVPAGKTFATGDSIMCSFTKVRAPEWKQLLAQTTYTPACQCELRTQAIPVIIGRDTVCQREVVSYKTAANMTGYTWSVNSGNTIISGINDSIVTVAWNASGRGVVTAVYTSQTGVRMQVRDTVWVVRAPQAALVHHGNDTLFICADTVTNLNNQYRYFGSDTTISFSAVRGMNPMLTGNAVAKASTEGWYYAQAKANNRFACTSVVDSLVLKKNALPVITISGHDTVESCYSSPYEFVANTQHASLVNWTENGAGSIINGQHPNANEWRAAYSGQPTDAGKLVKIVATAHGGDACATRIVRDTVNLFVLPRAAEIKTTILTQPLVAQTPCTDTLYEVLVTTTKGDSLQHIIIEMRDAGSNFNVLADTSYIELPYRSGQKMKLANSPILSGSLYTWELPADVWLRKGDTLRLSMRMGSKGVGFVSGSTVTFRATAKNGCLENIASTTVTSRGYNIQGIDPLLHQLDVQAGAQPKVLSVCNTNYISYKVQVINSGPAFAQSNLEDMVVYMPSVYHINLDSFKAIYNSPSINNVESEAVINGERQYRISLNNDNPLSRGDTAIFSFGVIPAADFCGTAPLRIELQNKFSVSCINSDYPVYGVAGYGADTVTAQGYQLDVLTVRDVADYSRVPGNNKSTWSGRVVLRNNGSLLTTGMTVRTMLVDDANSNSIPDAAEQTTPLASRDRVLSRNLIAGDTLQFVFNNIPFMASHQMLTYALIEPACNCAAINAWPLATIAGGRDTVCRNDEVVYATTPGMTSYTWVALGGSIVGQANGSSVKVRWEDMGVATLTVSYRDHRPGNPTIQQVRRRILVLSQMQLALTQDSIAMCDGEQVNLTTTVPGGGSAIFYYDSQLQQPLPQGNYVVGASGTYYAQAVGANGCLSNKDSVQVNVKLYLSKPAFADTLIYQMVGGRCVFRLTNDYEAGVQYAWTPANPAGNVASYTIDPVDVNSSGRYQVAVSREGTCAPDPSSARLVAHNVEVTKAVADESADGFARQGEQLTYEILVVNRGASTISSLRVVDSVPAYTRYLSGGSLQGNAVVFNESDIPPRGEALLRFAVRTVNDLADKNVDHISNLAHVYVDGLHTTSTCVSGSCIDDSTVIYVNARKVTFPNVFTPNGDGRNDVFKVGGLEQYQNVEFSVVNRWGNSVYHNSSYQNFNNWDGGNLVEGVYYYTLIGRDYEGHEEKYTGYIHLMR